MALRRRFVAGNIAALTGFEGASLQSGAELWDERIHAEDRASANRAVSAERSVEFRWQHADGSYRYFLDQAIPLADGSSVAGSVRDVTEQHRLQEQLLQAQKLDALGKLTGGIAHDFNNLLASVLGGLNLIERRTALDEKSAQVLGMTRHAAMQGKELISRMLAFSRRQSLMPQSVSLHAVKEALEAMLAPVLGGLVVLNWDLSDDCWPVFVDQSQLELALMNLIINARDAMPGGGTIAVRATNQEIGDGDFGLSNGQYVNLSIIDTGAGIPPELLDKVMEPFFTTKDVGKGTGLGLSMVYGTLKQIGGFIFVESEVGRGTTFKLYFPPAVVKPAPPAPPPAAHEDHPTGTETLLVVEDETAVRNLVASALRHDGYQLLLASSAEEAMKLVEAHSGRIDLLLTDAIMPGKSGLELANMMVAKQPGLPVIVMSGYTEENLSISGLTEPPAMLQKPFTPRDLRRRIREVLDR